MSQNIVLIIVGFIILIKGADFLVKGATQIAKKFKISEMVIGMTVVAMGTSLPELIVSVKSAFEGHSDISIGNVIGSNLINMLLILGICAIIKGLHINKEVRMADTPFHLLITFLMLMVCNFGAQVSGISRTEGVIFLVIFIFYLVFMIAQAKKASYQEKQKQSYKKEPMWKSVLWIIIGAIGLKFGADFVVDNAVIVAQIIGMSEKVIGLTIVAIGTSLPELASSITAVRKGVTDLAVGNIIGSNIFNILLILGTTAMIKPIEYNVSYNLDITVLFIAAVLLMFFPYFGKKNTMTRREGFLYVLIYIIYTVTLLIR